MLFIGQPFFNKEIREGTRVILRQRVVEIVERQNLDEISQLIGLRLLDILEEKDYTSLLKDTKLIKDFVKVFEASGHYTEELDNYEYYEPYKLFRKVALANPSIFRKKFVEVITTCNVRDLITIIASKLLSLIKKEDLINFFNKSSSQENEKFIERFSIALKKTEVIDPATYEDCFWIIELLKKKEINTEIKN